MADDLTGQPGAVGVSGFDLFIGIDHSGALEAFFDPPLTLPERAVAALEGWIPGVR